MSKEKDEAKDIKIPVGCLKFSNGPAVINGLNLIGAIVTHPEAKAVARKVLRQVHEQSGSSYRSLMNDIIHSLDYIVEINKMLNEMGMKPIFREERYIDWTDYNNKEN